LLEPPGPQSLLLYNVLNAADEYAGIAPGSIFTMSGGSMPFGPPASPDPDRYKINLQPTGSALVFTAPLYFG
jgi:hypothetical protein